MRENHRRNHSQRACGEEKKSNKGTKTARRTRRSGAMMRRTEKSKANSRQKSKANNRQKSNANGRHDKSRANCRQSKPKDCDRDKAKYEEKHSTEESCSQQCRCPAGARRSDHDCPKDRLRRGNRGVQENHPDSSEAATQKVQKTVKIPQIRDCEHSDGFFQLEKQRID